MKVVLAVAVLKWPEVALQASTWHSSCVHACRQVAVVSTVILSVFEIVGQTI